MIPNHTITLAAQMAKEFKIIVQPLGNSTIQINSFDDYQFHELDLINISRLGRQWFGESFDFKPEKSLVLTFLTLIVPYH
jgi:hypothetical protein